MKEFSQMDFLAGEVLLIDKALTWSSFDVVNKIRYLLRNHLGIRKIKVGHAGTLDPLASGLVIVCTGKATKQIDQYMGWEKQYLADMHMGETTPTYDRESEPDNRYPYEHITQDLMEDCCRAFTGELDQVPPAFSAVKIKGQKAYDLARRGKKVELKSRKITIHSMDLLKFDLPLVSLKVNCSKGTYIRSLVHDMGQYLHSGAHLSGLRRTQIGLLSVDNAWTIQEFEKKLTTFATNL
jgi:tRNA pseudouridine55 synthase